MIVYAVVDDALSPNFPLGAELEVFVGREDAERFIEEVARRRARDRGESSVSRSGSSRRAGNSHRASYARSATPHVSSDEAEARGRAARAMSLATTFALPAP